MPVMVVTSTVSGEVPVQSPVVSHEGTCPTHRPREGKERLTLSSYSDRVAESRGEKTSRLGRAPPMDPFNRETADNFFEDWMDIMKAPAVSGSHDYKELCLASKNEERRLAEATVFQTVSNVTVSQEST